MRVVRDSAQLERRPRSVALGTFDGVHSGHRAVVRRALEYAAERGLTSAVVTFDRHPLAVVDPSRAPRLLTPLAEKVRLLGELGPDELVLLPFDERLAALTPADFCAQILAGALDARVVVVGENFHFGAGGAGDATELCGCGARHGFETVALSLVTEHGRPVSSTRIRQLLGAGRLEEVREILDRPPSATGRVVSGDRRGRSLGVPTANVDVEAGTIFPGRGVYAALVRVGDASFRAAVNIGHNPTFRDNDADTVHVTVEAHLLGFSGDLYDRDIRVDFLHRIREERRFESIDELVAQMRCDIAETAALRDPAFVEAGLPTVGPP